MDRSFLRISTLLSVFELAQPCRVICSASATAALRGQSAGGRMAADIALLTVMADRENRVSEELFAKARRDGVVRVIVELQMPMGSDEAYERRIHEVQQRVLRELTGTVHALVRSFTAVPTLVLEASDAALQILASSNYVLRVSEDGLAAPLSHSSIHSRS